MGKDSLGTGRQAPVGIRQQRTVLFRQEETGGNGIHTDTFAKLHGQLATKVLGEIDDCCLCRTITCYTSQRTEGCLRSYINDRALALLSHGTGKDLGRKDCAEEIQFDYLAHGGEVEVEDSLVRRDCSPRHISPGSID